MKLPAIQFYPGDWLQDEIAGCSLAAQGLWLRLLFLMHGSTRYGYLTMDGRNPAPPDWICRKVGISEEAYATLLAELSAAQVPSFTKAGLLYSRRLVRDDEKRAKNREYVSKYRKTHAIGKDDVQNDVSAMSVPSSSSTSYSNSNSKDLSKQSEGTKHLSTSANPPMLSADTKAMIQKVFRDVFWPKVWLRKGRIPAEKAFPAALAIICRERKCKAPEAAELLASWAVRQREWGLIDESYRKLHPSTWLNQRRWEDEPPQPKCRSTANGKPLRGSAAFESLGDEDDTGSDSETTTEKRVSGSDQLLFH